MSIEFRTISGFDNYEVSSDGQIYRKEHETLQRSKKNLAGVQTDNMIVKKRRVCKPTLNKKTGYLQCCIVANDHKTIKTMYVHRAVALAWLGNPDNLEQVDHRNQVKTDCRVENLEWVSRNENMRRMFTRKVLKEQQRGI